MPEANGSIAPDTPLVTPSNRDTVSPPPAAEHVFPDGVPLLNRNITPGQSEGVDGDHNGSMTLGGSREDITSDNTSPLRGHHQRSIPEGDDVDSTGASSDQRGLMYSLFRSSPVPAPSFTPVISSPT